MEFEEFVKTHGILLASSGLPAALYPKLHQKLLNDVFDGGHVFKIAPCERRRRLLLSSERLDKDSDVFLVDHAWTFRLPDARQQLEKIPGLAERMANLMCVADDADNDEITDGSVEVPEEGDAESVVSELAERGREVLWLELDELGIDDDKLQLLNLPSKFPNLVGLSLWGNRLESSDVLLRVISGLHSLRGLWLNENPVTSCDKVLEAILQVSPSLEIYNSQLLDNFGHWAMGFCCGQCGSDNPIAGAEVLDRLEKIEQVDLSNRGVETLPTTGFNAVSLPRLSHIDLRGNPLKKVSRLDLVQTLRSFPSLKSMEIDIPGPLGSSAVKIANDLPNLVQLNGMSVDKIMKEDGKDFPTESLKPRLPEWSANEPLVERVLRAMWSYVMTYRLADAEKLDETPIWYIMDELGSALRHSDDPNMRVAPFMFLVDGSMKSAVSYTLMWPIKDIVQGEECRRDYLPGVDEKQQRSARLTAWFHTPTDYFEKAFEEHHGKHSGLETPVVADTDTQTLRCGRRPITVYSDIPHVCDFLSRPEFALVEEPSEADIVWTGDQIDEESSKFLGLRKDQYINQYPFEICLVMKHCLAETMRQAYGAPDWLPTTYNLESQLAALIGDYNTREKRGDDNLWIVKPWNMARTIDTTVMKHLPAIIRHLETGPKICQKYIENPALFHGKKFDLRYIVLLRSLTPLELFLCDVFWTRLALNDYTTDESSLCDYETHFTVMNYRNKLNHLNTHDFVPQFEEEHKVKWSDIHERVRGMLRAVFEAASSVHPEMHSPTSRAIYGVDVMLDSTFQPKLLEVTYCPDCARACKFDVKKVVGESVGSVMKGAEFFNSVFGCLFLDEITNVSAL